MKTVEAIVEKSELIYPEKNNHGFLNGIPLYETIFVIKEKKKKSKFFFYDQSAYFDVGSKIDVIPNGDNIIIPSFQNISPYRINSFAELGRKYPRITIYIFMVVLAWIIILAFMKNTLAVLPVGFYWITNGVYNLIIFLKFKKGIIIKATIKDIACKSTSSNSKKYSYVYEYEYNNHNLVHTSFFNGKRKNNIGKQINLIYTEKHNTIMEKNKRKNLFISGLMNIIFGIVFIILLFIV